MPLLLGYIIVRGYQRRHRSAIGGSTDPLRRRCAARGNVRPVAESAYVRKSPPADSPILLETLSVVAEARLAVWSGAFKARPRSAKGRDRAMRETTPCHPVARVVDKEISQTTQLRFATSAEVRSADRA